VDFISAYNLLDFLSFSKNENNSLENSAGSYTIFGFSKPSYLFLLSPQQ